MPTPVLASVVTAVTNATTTFANVTGLTFAVSANSNYAFRFVLHHTSSATTIGIRFAVNGPAATSLRVGGIVPISTVAANFGSQTAYDTAIFASTTGTTTAVMSIVEGVVRVSSSGGTLACRFAAEVAASGAVVVLANSHGILIPLA